MLFTFRLGLERGQTAKQCLDIIVALLESHGQGGPHTPDPIPSQESARGSSFLICDPSEAWVVETVGGGHWAAERVTSTPSSLCLYTVVTSLK